MNTFYLADGIYVDLFPDGTFKLRTDRAGSTHFIIMDLEMLDLLYTILKSKALQGGQRVPDSRS